MTRFLSRPRPTIREKLLGQRGLWMLAPLYLVVFLGGVVWDLLGGDPDMAYGPAAGFAVLAGVIIAAWAARPTHRAATDALAEGSGQ